MRKIDVDKYYRLLEMMENLAEDLRPFPEELSVSGVADQIIELESDYDNYLLAVKELKQSVKAYFNTYASAYSCYKHGLTIRRALPDFCTLQNRQKENGKEQVLRA